MSNFSVFKSSAGSGKTFNLVKNYLKIALSDNANPPQAFKRILAITFTNKAAGEMKERVIETLKNLSDPTRKEGMRSMLREELQLSEDKLAERSQALLNSILHNYADFSVGTIDSFIHRIVRTFALDLRLPLNFTIEMNRDLILAECIDELAKKVGEDNTITQILVEFSQTRMEEDKNWRVDNEILSFTKKFLNEEGLERLEKIRATEITQYMQVEKQMSSYVSMFYNELTQKGKSVLDWMKGEGLDSSDFYQGKRGVWNYFKKISEGIFDDSVYGSYVRQTHEEDKWKSSKSKLTSSQIEQLKLWFGVSEEYRNEGKGTYFTYQVLLANIYSLMMISEIEKILFSIKQEQNIVFIHEFNNMIAEIVKKEPAPFVYERLGEHYTHYLVDEFQDTSELQWKNLIPLLDNSLGNGNFNLVVGDGKQSIYRWRGGDVEQFADLPFIKGEKDQLTLEREESLRRNYKEEILKVNFRSKQNIITFNNNLYEWMREEILPDSLAKVYENCNQDGKPDNEGGYVSIDFISEGTEEGEEKVCEKIVELVRKNTEEFGYAYSDITLLTRNKKNGKLAADFLLSNGIPIVSNESLLLNKNENVNALVSLLYLAREERASIHEANLLHYFSKRDFFSGLSFQESLHEFQKSGKDIFRFSALKKYYKLQQGNVKRHAIV